MLSQKEKYINKGKQRHQHTMKNWNNQKEQANTRFYAPII